MKKYYYLNDKNLKNGFPCVVQVSDEPIKDYETYFLQRELFVREYINESLPERLVWDEKLKVVREATETEKYILSKETYTLKKDTYYIKNEEVRELPQKEKFYLKPSFNIETEKWEELASDVELRSYDDAVYREFYYKELNDFNKATTEFNAGILTQEQYDECRTYIQSVQAQLNAYPRVEVKKPIQMNY